MRKLKVFLFLTMLLLSSTYTNAVSLDSISPSKLLRYAKRVRYGINTDVNLERAAKIYSYLAKKGNADAQRELGCMFLNGEGVSKNYKVAHSLLKKACLSNDTKAMCAMAYVYQYGLGTKTNKSLAFKLYLRAARMGNAIGCYGAGNMLYKGQGVKQNYQKAEEILLKGSEKGNAKCDFLLANYYAYGFGGTPDYSKAKEFLNKAVRNGHGWTVDMTLFNKLDSVIKQNNIAASKPALAKAQGRSTTVKVDNSSDIIGYWKGTMAVYDWGKTRVLSEEPIAIEVFQDTCLVVTCLQNDSVISIFRSDKQLDNKWQKEHVCKTDKIYKWIPLSISFEKSSDNFTLYANVNRLNASERSALKPVKFTLQREGSTTNISNVLVDGKVSVSPLPMQNDFTVTLSVTSATDVNVSIFNLAGMKVADYGTRQLNAGSNSLSFHSTLSAGEYILKVKGKSVREVLKFIHL